MDTKTQQLKKLIKEAVREVVKEELSEILKEAILGNSRVKQELNLTEQVVVPGLNKNTIPVNTRMKFFETMKQETTTGGPVNYKTPEPTAKNPYLSLFAETLQDMTPQDRANLSRLD